jgi:hypothetical protein
MKTMMIGRKKIVLRRSADAPTQTAAAATATKDRKSELAGVGCLVQLIGLAIVLCGIPFGAGGLVFSILVGLAVMVVGGRMAHKYLCSHCGNRVQEKTARICAACGAHFTN